MSTSANADKNDDLWILPSDFSWIGPACLFMLALGGMPEEWGWRAAAQTTLLLLAGWVCFDTWHGQYKVDKARRHGK